MGALSVCPSGSVAYGISGANLCSATVGQVFQGRGRGERSNSPWYCMSSSGDDERVSDAREACRDLIPCVETSCRLVTLTTGPFPVLPIRDLAAVVGLES